jgi:hypothetical protein
MASLSVWKAYELTVDGEQIVGGSRSSPTTITVDGKRKEWYRSLATATTATVWDGTDTNEPISNFDYFYIESDQALILEFTIDKGNEVGDEIFAIQLQANVPFDLLSDDAYALFVSLTSLTEDLIDRIRVRNISGSTANVRAMLIT